MNNGLPVPKLACKRKLNPASLSSVYSLQAPCMPQRLFLVNKTSSYLHIMNFDFDRSTSRITDLGAQLKVTDG